MRRIAADNAGNGLGRAGNHSDSSRGLDQAGPRDHGRVGRRGADCLTPIFRGSWIGARSESTARRRRSVLQRYEAGEINEASDLYRTTSQAAYDSVNDSLDRVTRLNVASATAASDQADAAYRNSRLLIIVAMTVAAILVMIALACVSRFISMPLLELARGMRRLAETTLVSRSPARSGSTRSVRWPARLWGSVPTPSS